jgi:hypothetical protein
MRIEDCALFWSPTYSDLHYIPCSYQKFLQSIKNRHFFFHVRVYLILCASDMMRRSMSKLGTGSSRHWNWDRIFQKGGLLYFICFRRWRIPGMVQCLQPNTRDHSDNHDFVFPQSCWFK